MSKTSTMTKRYKYKFSFVMPVYNVEDYLAETIESVIAQTMDFEENVEIILINDGSPDNSEEVCLRYKEQFPDNIKYIKQDNAGVSAARNRGIKEASGKYVSFLDSDDKLSSNALEKVYGFFEAHYGEIDFVSIKLEVFDARQGSHPLNYKFHTTRVIDVNEEYDAIQLHAASSFVKNEALVKSQIRFDEQVAISEDAKFMAELVLDKLAYGVLTKPTYYYRKRQSNNSAIDGSTKNKTWYNETLKKVHEELFDFAMEKNGYLPKYLQFVIMYEVQWRFKQQEQRVLTEKQQETYKKRVIDVIKRIDDDIILEQKNLRLEEKIFILDKKYDHTFMQHLTQEGGKFYHFNTLICDYSTVRLNVHLELMSIDDDQVVFEGCFNGPLLLDTKLKFRVDNKLYDVEPTFRPRMQARFLGELVFDRNCFKVKLPLKAGTSISPRLVGNGMEVELPLVANKHMRLNQTIGRAYRVCGDFLMVKRPNSLEIEEKTKRQYVLRELKYMAALFQSMKLRSLALRMAYYLYVPFAPNKVWLLSDRVVAAGDNAEALFRYITTRDNLEVTPYFVISKSSKDYESLKKYGKVVNYDSLHYKLLFLAAEKIISSHADAFVTNAFDGREHNVSDLYKFDFVFLQHGITHNDISKWLNRYNKNIKLFVTAAVPEYDSLLTNDYSYDKNVVKLTGFPRYDLLNNKPKDKLILAPTWRKNIVGQVDLKTATRLYNKNFVKSEYFAFYSKLMRDPRIQAALKSKNMVGEFYLHPSLSAQVDDYEDTEYFKIKPMPYDYRTAFSEGDILITDYSSVAFDFAYLKKPVIYTQFDKEQFYSEHMWDPGYFSYEENGFGSVVYEYEESVKEIISTIENNSVMHKKYVNRVEKFFYHNDKKNCQRTYDAIRALDK